MVQLADRVTAIQTARRAGVAESGSESNNLNFGLCEVVYEWAKGRVGAVSSQGLPSLLT